MSSPGRKGFAKRIIQVEEEVLEEEVAPSEAEVGIMIAKLLSEELKWNESVGHTPRVVVYHGDSLRTQQRKKAEEKKRVESMAGSKNLSSFFSSSSSHEEEVPEQSRNLLTIEDAIERLEEETEIGKSVSENESIEPYQLLRFLTLKVYFRKFLVGEKKMAASVLVASEFWQEKPYHATRIRRWADEYLLTGDLAPHQQGTHSKIPPTQR